MRAVIVTAPGGTEALEIAETAVPVPGPGQVRIAVAAAAVNPIDIATRSGFMAQVGAMPPFGAPGSRPSIGLGWDVAGTVDAVGDGVTGLAVGDEVIGVDDRLDVALGTHADAAVLDAGAVAPAPRSAGAVHAATLPLNGLTALQGLDLLDLAPGGTLLVTGAAGAVGGYAVELAAHRGLRVIAVAKGGASDDLSDGSSDAPSAASGATGGDEALVRGLGAEHFVPSGAHLADAVRAIVPGGVDGALDAAMLGGSALDAVRGGGAFTAVSGGPVVPGPMRGTTVRNVWVRGDSAQLAELSALVDAGRLTLRVAEALPLAEVAKAHARVEAGGLRGRVVLVP